MHAPFPSAANLLRSCLVSGKATPAIVRAALNDVPSEHHDAWLDQLWDIDEIPDDAPNLPRGCVPYLPCPAAAVLSALEQAEVTSNDVFVDIGAGVGRTAFLTHVLTGATCIGIEIQPPLAKAAMERAAWLNLDRMQFIEGDAVDWIRFPALGTVFFLYCPFSGDRLQRFLDGLESVARVRQIRVCCVHLPRLDRPWLLPMPPASAELQVYRSAHFCC